MKHRFHKWGKWSQDISIVDDKYFVARNRICKKCGLVDAEHGYIAGIKPPCTP